MSGRWLRSLSSRSAAAAAVVALAACGASGKLEVAVVTKSDAPVVGAVVTIPGTRAAGTTNSAGDALLTGLRPGLYEITASAHGYSTVERRAHVRPGSPVVVTLTYRPPLGAFVFDLGPDDDYWDQLIVTRAAVTMTEYDWICTAGKDGKLVGGWVAFPSIPPDAADPGVLNGGWTRGRFPASGPPAPRSDCETSSLAGARGAAAARHAVPTPFYALPSSARAGRFVLARNGYRSSRVSRGRSPVQGPAGGPHMSVQAAAEAVRRHSRDAPRAEDTTSTTT